ncbi:hypothetical protein BKA83DRAFT_4129132 [Pisolithus microcarpus]|nr:hypothetical protein BKA83DRAFT_4129132 [Pisolithus microcarpus]
MPVKDFLDEFLPTSHIPNYHSMMNQFKEGVSFGETVQAKSKLDMYTPFIDEMMPFAPQLRFVDSHAQGDKKNRYTFEIKPDISIYHNLLNGPIPTGCNSSTLNMHIKFKWYNFNNPFLAPPEDQNQATSCHIPWEGAIITEPISCNVNPLLTKFFSHYSQAPPELHSVDTTVSPAPRDEAMSTGAKLGLSPDTAMFKTTIPRNGDSLPFMIIYTLLDILPSTPACHRTHVCPAYDLSGDHVVFFKDSWHINAPDIIPEGDIYAQLNEKHVPHVPTCLASSNVRCWPKQEPQTVKHSEPPWACQQGLVITSHTHYQLILDLIGERLTNFASSQQLVQAVHNALLAHREAYVVGILHQDISTGNIIIFLGCGYLIDWDLAKARSMQRPHQLTCTGTWQFMSACLVEDVSAFHTFWDDLESAFWVLLWTALMFSKSSLSVDTCSKFIWGTFKLAPGGEGKQSVLVSQNKLKPNLFANCPSLCQLLTDLADLFSFHYYTPKEHEWEFLVLPENPMTREITLMQALPIFFHNQSLRRLENHDYAIEHFAFYMKSETWPEDDAAVAQELIGINSWGEEGLDKVVVLKSKHILECILEEEEEERNYKKRSRVEPAGLLSYFVMIKVGQNSGQPRQNCWVQLGFRKLKNLAVHSARSTAGPGVVEVTNLLPLKGKSQRKPVPPTAINPHDVIPDEPLEGLGPSNPITGRGTRSKETFKQSHCYQYTNNGTECPIQKHADNVTAALTAAGKSKMRKQPKMAAEVSNSNADPAGLPLPSPVPAPTQPAPTPVPSLPFV